MFKKLLLQCKHIILIRARYSLFQKSLILFYLSLGLLFMLTDWKLISKAWKCWKKLSNSEKIICTSMLEVYRGLSPLEEEKLIEYMDF
jgi:hypothetical protein